MLARSFSKLEAGVLVLSEFAGAGQALGAGCVRVNPYNTEERRTLILTLTQTLTLALTLTLTLTPTLTLTLTLTLTR